MIICRCEGVTSADIEEAIAKYGCRNLNQVKRMTRSGMGLCQGRTCHSLVALALAKVERESASYIPLRARPPVTPVPLARLAALAPHIKEPKGTVNAAVVWGLSEGAQGTLPDDPTAGEDRA